MPALPLQPMDSKALDRTIAAYRTNAEAFKEQYGEIVRNFAEAVYTAYTQTTYQYEGLAEKRCLRFYTRRDVDDGSYVCSDGFFRTPGEIGRKYRQTTAHFDGKVINDLLKSLDYYTPGSVCEPMPTPDFNKRAEEKLAFVESFVLRFLKTFEVKTIADLEQLRQSSNKDSKNAVDIKCMKLIEACDAYAAFAKAWPEIKEHPFITNSLAAQDIINDGINDARKLHDSIATKARVKLGTLSNKEGDREARMAAKAAAGLLKQLAIKGSLTSADHAAEKSSSGIGGRS